ncbi:cytidine deaminase-like protein [Epithele typhae]|uniref:cytidine deaminase-like protein n=1 Tax=Epithele typhae TaxID=378194 RepID=UPI0020081AD0|nr:cytidine deaminase-like protein [Epithele typhae]KAH9944164.1 cytidine deaminase-like protein [Epithele typhae]
MFIAIIGTRCSGKSTVQDYLVKYKEFRPVKILQGTSEHPLLFGSAAELLAHVTKNWRTNFVTIDLITRQVLEDFRTRPFVLVVGVDAPLLTRFRRISELANLHVVNAFESITAFYEHLEETNLVDPERLRPGWDTYFMQLASLASQRSNCMKRRVGAILVRNKRVVSTGYNGTPRGLTNCNEGGCVRCNSASESSDECLCLHAEENALLEAGRERVGDGSVLYCNTCPCLKCTIKIIQTGVKEVVYNLSYKVDDASAAQFSEAGVVLRRHAMRA